MKVSLNKMATLLGCHPRTVLRAITGEKNPSWSESYNPEFDIADIAKAYHCNKEFLEAALRGEDKLLNPSDAAKKLKVTERCLRYRPIEPLIRRGGVVRYLKTTIELAQSGVI